MVLSFEISNQTLSRIDTNKIVSKSVNYLEANFSFSEDWDDFTKRAIFIKGKNVYDAIISDGSCKVPWEVINESGTMHITVVGITADSRVTTNAVDIEIIDSMYEEGNESNTPTISILESILAAFGVLRGGLANRVLKKRTDADFDFEWSEFPTKVSDLTNDSGFITSEDIPEIPTKLSELENDADYAKTSDIPEVPTKLSELINDADYAKTSDIPEVPIKLSELENDADYAKTSDIPEVPTKVSELENDSKFISEKGFRLINRITLDEDVASYEINADVDDQPFDLSEIVITLVNSSGILTSTGYMLVKVSDGVKNAEFGNSLSAAYKFMRNRIEVLKGFGIMGHSTRYNGGAGYVEESYEKLINNSTCYYNFAPVKSQIQSIKSIEFYNELASNKLKSGTVIDIYGR